MSRRGPPTRSRRGPPSRSRGPPSRGRGPPSRTRGPPSRGSRGPPSRSRNAPYRRSPGPSSRNAPSRSRNAPYRSPGSGKRPAPSRSPSSGRKVNRGPSRAPTRPTRGPKPGRPTGRGPVRSTRGPPRTKGRGPVVSSRAPGRNPLRRGPGPVTKGRRSGPGRRGPGRRGPVRSGPGKRGPGGSGPKVSADRFNFVDDSKLPPVLEFKNVQKVYIQGNQQSVCPKMPTGGKPMSNYSSGPSSGPVTTGGPPSAPGLSKPPSAPKGPMSMPNMGGGPPRSGPPMVPSRSPGRAPSRGPAKSWGRAPKGRNSPKTAPRTRNAPKRPGGRSGITRTAPTRRAPYKKPTKSSSGGGNIQDQIKKLEQEKKEALANEEYEKCGVLKKKINALKEELKKQSAAPAAKFDKVAYDKAIRKLEDKKKGYIANEEYEKCAPLRDLKKELEGIKKQWDSSGGSPALEKKLKGVISRC